MHHQNTKAFYVITNKFIPKLDSSMLALPDNELQLSQKNDKEYNKHNQN